VEPRIRLYSEQCTVSVFFLLSLLSYSLWSVLHVLGTGRAYLLSVYDRNVPFQIIPESTVGVRLP